MYEAIMNISQYANTIYIIQNYNTVQNLCGWFYLQIYKLLLNIKAPRQKPLPLQLHVQCDTLQCRLQ